MYVRVSVYLVSMVSPQLARILSHSFFLQSSTMTLTATVSIPRLNKNIIVPTGLFINNEFVPSIDSQELIQSVFLASMR